jgi:hypothetical protein
VLAHLVVADRPGEDPVTNPHQPLSLGSMNQRSCPAPSLPSANPGVSDIDDRDIRNREI